MKHLDFPKMYMRDNLPNHLCQGDIFRRLSGKLLPPTEPKEIGFIVATNTCDLVNKKNLSFVSVCPVHKLEVIFRKIVKKNEGKSFEDLKIAVIEKLHQVSIYKPKFYFFLSPLADFGGEAAYANLGQIFSIKKLYIESMLANRFAVLKSPWREKLGYKIGFLYNRVATKDVERKSIEDFVTKALPNLMSKGTLIDDSSSDELQ